jgi:hypothetical protein
MIRTISLALVLLAACGHSKSEGNHDQAPAKSDDVVAVPGAKAALPAAPAAPDVSDDPKKHLQPDEGTLEIGKADCKGDAATIKVTPASGYHVSTEFPVKLDLAAPSGVTLAKAELTKDDASPFTEKELAFAVKATCAQPGSYEIKGTFKFGVCDKDSCHPKKQPITIQVAAN